MIPILILYISAVIITLMVVVRLILCFFRYVNTGEIGVIDNNSMVNLNEMDDATDIRGALWAMCTEPHPMAIVVDVLVVILFSILAAIAVAFLIMFWPFLLPIFSMIALAIYLRRCKVRKAAFVDKLRGEE